MAEQKLISYEECLRILHAQNGRAPITNIQLEPLTNVAGFLGEYYQLCLVTEPVWPARRTVYESFLKTLPQKNHEYRAGVLKKECFIYRVLLTNLQKYINCKLFADCYLARDNLLVLENLTEKYQQFKQIFTATQYRLILRRLATLHASSIAWERADNFCIGERYKEQLCELLLSSKNEWFITGIKAIVYLAAKHAQFRDCESQFFIKYKLYDILLKAEKLAQPSKKLCNVFCHRDLSIGNIFFNAAEGSTESCLFVDFGIATYSTPAIDIHFLLYINSTIEERRSMYKELTDFYFNALQAQFNLLDIPDTEISRKDFDLDCKRGHLAGLIMSAICLPLFKIPSELTKKLRQKDSKKFDYWMNVERSELLELAMENSSAYRSEVMSIIAELVEYLKTEDYLDTFE